MSIFYGADISQYQGDINWQAFNTGASFVIIKASGGDAGLYADDNFAQNRDAVRALGNDMPHGFYHMGGTGDAIEEADFFVNTVGELQVGEVLVLDAENATALDPAWMKTFLDHVTALVGFKPLVYMSSSRLFERDYSQVVAGDYGLWVANYVVDPTATVHVQYWTFYTMHQYKNNGTFPGIAGNVDTDAFFADDLMAFFKYGKPATIVTPPAIPITSPPVIELPTPDPVVIPEAAPNAPVPPVVIVTTEPVASVPGTVETVKRKWYEAFFEWLARVIIGIKKENK